MKIRTILVFLAAWVGLSGSVSHVSAQGFPEFGDRGSFREEKAKEEKPKEEKPNPVSQVDFLARSAAASLFGIDARGVIASQSIWRGIVLTDKLSAQPSLTVGFGRSGFAVNIWGSVAIADQDMPGVKEADEVDVTLSFDRSFGGPGRAVGISLGVIEYVFPRINGQRRTEEVFFGLSLGNPINPNVVVYYDFGQFDSFYAAIGVNTEVPLDVGGTTRAKARVSVGFSDKNGSFGFNDVTISVFLGVKKGALTVGPTARFVYTDNLVNVNKDQFWGGIEASFTR
ncbi:MAG: hypothetical protein O7G87_07050 [bacterium]|nr:hypothetical protein [bacterium]